MSNELYHHGVLGMKWGVRKDRSRSGGSRGSHRKKNWSDDAKEASTLRKKKVGQMSNSELKKLNERTRLEQEYSRLNPGKVRKGWKFVAGAAGVMGTALAVYNNSSQMVKLGNKFVDSVVGDAVISAVNETFKRS